MTTTQTEFRFADLFAGIGGIRTAFEGIGGRCVFTSEWDKFARRTYGSNFPEVEEHPEHVFVPDITTIAPSQVLPHDVLLAGFPCQPFSIAGVSKKNALGRAHGFDDPTQGTLFFNVKEIIDAKRPAAFLLENVRNLKSHDRGETFRIIDSTLKGLGYQVQSRVVNGKHFVPQNRERILIVGFRQANDFDIDALTLPDPVSTVGAILHRRGEQDVPHDEGRYFNPRTGQVNPKYTLTEHLWKYLQVYAEKHRAAGNGFGFGLVRPSDPRTRTLSARYYKDGSEILVSQPGKRPRRLTPRECARLMGFPDSFVIPVSDTQAYKQFGNSVVVPAITAMAIHMSPYIDEAVADHEAVA
ncbi:DNA (cytosine-5-)-methyltransferase [Terrabacter sp. 2YAF2]|uniref:DNA (cytosine-5-)-methyltransferase n=1 Tax=Terrabacter sp. 2YAF2 TaxID=3233026 RepID=UPI003F9E54D0